MTIHFEVVYEGAPGELITERDHLVLPKDMDELFRSPEEFLKEVVGTTAGLIRVARENRAAKSTAKGS